MIQVIRSMPDPPSLSERNSWRGDDVLNALLNDFYSKCYLCENAILRGSFEVDHRMPKGKHNEHAYTWTNLFASCRTCNGRRKKSWPNGGLLDPANAGDDVETRILQWLRKEDSKPMFLARVAGDVAAENTVRELDRMHNESHASCRDLRDTIRDYFIRVAEKVIDRLNAIQNAGQGSDDAIKNTAELRLMLSRGSPFTMLVRSRLPFLADLFD